MIIMKQNKKYGSAILNRAISGISLLNLVQTGIGTTEAQKLYKFTPGKVQYGKVEDILARRARAEENAKGLIDNSVSAIAIAAIPNKIGGRTITIPETAQAVVGAGEVVGTAGKVMAIPELGTGIPKAMLIASSVGSNLKDSDKVDDNKNIEKEKTPENRNLEEAASKVQETSQRIKVALKKNKTIIEVTRDGKRMYYDTKSKCYFYVIPNVQHVRKRGNGLMNMV